MPAALPVDWSEVRRASEQGVSDEDIAAKFGLPDKTAIRMRRSREQWLTPARIHQATAIARAKAAASKIGNQSIPPSPIVQNATAEGVTNGVTSVTNGQKDPVTALSVTAESLLQNGQKGSLIASKLALSLLEKAESEPEKLKALQDVYDVTAGLKVVRLAAGMDRAESTNLTVVQLGGWQASLQDVGDSGRIIEQRQDGPDSHAEGPSGDSEADPAQDSGDEDGRF